MSQVSDANQYDALSSPIEGKTREEGRSRFGKDDVKEQAYQAREQVKSRVTNLTEQVVNSDAFAKAKDTLNSGIAFAKAKAGIAADKPTEEVLAEAQEKGAEQWETVKRKGANKMKQASATVDQKLDENLTPDQRQKLNKGLKQAKAGAFKLEKQAEGFSNQLLNRVLAGPALRPVKTFIQRNNLQLPAVILGAFLSLYLGLSLIRLITSVTTPAVPEFDIHSKTATTAWLKYHAGEYKGKALDAKESLTGRAAAFLANHEWDKLKANAIDYRDVGMKKLGLQEPTWTEYAWAKLTGRPITWQDRVEGVLNLAKDGINRVDLKRAGLFDRVKDMLKPHEPTMAERAAGVVDAVKARMPGAPVVEPSIVDSIKNKLADGYDTVRSNIPGSASYEQAKQAAYDAAHPSTITQLKNGAEYVKNRIVHGAQEAAHIAQDKANRVVDEAKLKTGL